MNAFHEYLAGISLSWNEGQYLEAFFKVFLPLLIISSAFWLLSALVSIFFSLIVPALVILFLVVYISQH